MMERPQLGTCLYMISYVSDRDPGLGRYIVRPVIQRNVGNGGAVRFGLRQLQGRPGAAAGEQAQRQRRRWDTLVHKNLPI